jgi:hypothetical protein
VPDAPESAPTSPVKHDDTLVEALDIINGRLAGRC